MSSEKRMLFVWLARARAAARPIVATVNNVPVEGRGKTVSGAMKSLERRVRLYAREHGVSDDLAKAAVDHGIIRAFVPSALNPAPVPATGRVLQTLQLDPLELALSMSPEEVERHARRMRYWEFEERVVRDVPERWDLALAERFNAWLSQHDVHPEKPLVLDIRRNASFEGQHCRDRIRMRRELSSLGAQRGQSSLDAWRTFLHELAHYRVLGHRRPFVLEFGRVYRLWREWLTRESSALAVTAPAGASQGGGHG